MAVIGASPGKLTLRGSVELRQNIQRMVKNEESKHKRILTGKSKRVTAQKVKGATQEPRQDIQRTVRNEESKQERILTGKSERLIA